jgi:NADPH:quinone reductase-like Zn-dependent oxidoreductase
MKAVYLKRIGGPESLVLGKIPRPQPKAGEVLVKIHATAVTPTEFQWFPTFHTPAGESRPFPVVLSHEFSGVVESLGRPRKMQPSWPVWSGIWKNFTAS